MRTRIALVVLAALAASLSVPPAGANHHSCGGSFIGNASCSFAWTGEAIEIEGKSTGLEFWFPCQGTCAPSTSVDRAIQVVATDYSGREVLRCAAATVLRAECRADIVPQGYTIGVSFLCRAEALYASREGDGTVSEFICHSED